MAKNVELNAPVQLPKPQTPQVQAPELDLKGFDLAERPAARPTQILREREAQQEVQPSQVSERPQKVLEQIQTPDPMARHVKTERKTKPDKGLSMTVPERIDRTVTDARKEDDYAKGVTAAVSARPTAAMAFSKSQPEQQHQQEPYMDYVPAEAAPEPMQEQQVQEDQKKAEDPAPTRQQEVDSNDISEPDDPVSPPVSEARIGKRMAQVKARVAASVKHQNKKASANTFRRQHGQVLSSQLSSDYRMALSEISYGDEIVLKMFMQPESHMRQIVAENAPEADIDSMIADPEYAKQVLADMFNGNDITCAVTKYPVVDAADAHKRIVRVHNGYGSKLHPIVATIYNADFDGDTAMTFVTSDPAQGYAMAMEMLISPAGDVLLDNSVMNIRWHGNAESISKNIRTMLGSSVEGLTDAEVSTLASIIEDMSNGDKAEGRLARWLQAIAQDPARGDYAKTIDSVLWNLYDFTRKEFIVAEFDREIVNDFVQAKSKKSIEDQKATNDFELEAIPGQMPANSQDAFRAMGYPIAPKQGSNISWRGAASMAKAIKGIPEILMNGYNTWINPEGKTHDMSYMELLTQAMSKRANTGDTLYKKAAWMRRNVIEAVGYPKNYDSLEEFFFVFVTEYNRMQLIQRSAHHIALMDGHYESDEAYLWPDVPNDGTLNGKVADAFANVYGDMPMEPLLRNDAAANVMWPTVNEYIERGVGNMKTDDFKFSELTNDRLKAKLLQSRTSKAQSRNKEFLKVCDKAYDAIANHSGRNDAELADAIVQIAPEVLSYYGIDGIAGLRETEAGRALLSSKSADDFAGKIVGLVASYRFEPLTRLVEKHGKDAIAMTEWQQELDALKSTSFVYLNAAVDLDTNGSYWKTFCQYRGYTAGDSFMNDVLRNMDMPWSEKKAIIYDFLMNDNIPLDEKITSSESRTGLFNENFTLSDIFANPHQLHSGGRELGAYQKDSVRKQFKAASDAIDGYVDKNITYLKQEFNKLKDIPEDKWTAYFAGLNGGKDLITVNAGAIADAAVAVAELTSASGEKSSQEDIAEKTNTMVNMVVNGAMFSDMELAGSAVLGFVSAEQIVRNPTLLARVLLDKNQTYSVFDTSVVDMSELMSVDWSNKQEAMEQFEKHPRLQSVFRKSVMDRNGYLVGKGDLADCMLNPTEDTFMFDVDPSLVDTMHKVNRLLCDRPSFYAMAALLTEHQGRSMAKQRSMLSDAQIALLTNDMVRLAKMNETDAYREITDVATALKGNLEKYDTEYEKVSDVFFEFFKQSYLENIGILRDSGEALEYIEGVEEPTFYMDTETDIRHYLDTLQFISGSRTAMFTGINGAITQKNAALIYLGGVIPDPCDAPPMLIDKATFLSHIEDYVGCNIIGRNGRVEQVRRDWSELNVYAPNGMVQLYVPGQCMHESGIPCHHHMPANPSTQNQRKDSSVMGRWITKKRKDGTEKLNLKAKKVGFAIGDPQFDRITRANIWDENFILSNLASTGSMDPATIAERIMDVDNDLGYGGMEISEYEALAKYMVRTSPDGLSADLVPLEMTANAILEEITKTMVSSRENLEWDDCVKIAQQTFEAGAYFGQGDLTLSDVADSVSVSRYSKAWARKVSSAKPWSSAAARNIELSAKIMSRCFDGNLRLVSQTELEDMGKRTRNQDGMSAYRKFIPGKKDAYLVGAFYPGIEFNARDNAFAAIGPQCAVYLDSMYSQYESSRILNMANMRGNTVYFGTDVNPVAANHPVYGGLIQWSEQYGYFLPFYDIELNGEKTNSMDGSFNVGERRINYDLAMTTLAEVPAELLGIGDSVVVASQETLDAIDISIHGEYQVKLTDLFANFSFGKDPTHIEVSFPSAEEIKSILSDGMGFMRIDFGTDSRMKDEEERNFEAVDRYINAAFGSDGSGQWVTQSRSDEIVGFVKAYDRDSGQTCYAPIRMFDMRAGGSAVTDFRMEGEPSFVDGKVSIKWVHEGDIRKGGHSLKLFEEGHRSNKMILGADGVQNLTFRDGTPTNFYVGSITTASRRVNFNNVQLMDSMMNHARWSEWGFNFANVDGCLPDNPELRDGLANGTLSISDWKNAGEIAFYPDSYESAAALNAWCNRVVGKLLSAGVNPSHWFSSMTADGKNTGWNFDFRVAMDPTDSYNDMFMRWMHSMLPTYCPNGNMDTEGAKHTFHNEKMQRLVPIPVAGTGKVVEVWCNCYDGEHRFDDHYTGLHQPGRNAQSVFSKDTQVAYAYNGRYLTPRENSSMLDYMSTQVPKVHRTYGLESLRDDDLGTHTNY